MAALKHHNQENGRMGELNVLLMLDGIRGYMSPYQSQCWIYNCSFNIPQVPEWQNDKIGNSRMGELALLGFHRVAIIILCPKEWYLHWYKTQGCSWRLILIRLLTATTMWAVSPFIGFLSVHVIMWKGVGRAPTISWTLVYPIYSYIPVL